MELRIKAMWLVVILLVGACQQPERSDAYGQFEANEVTISTEVSGILKSFGVKEGARLEVGQQVGLIDTTQLTIQKRELEASKKSVRTNIAKLDAEINVYKAHLSIAHKDLERYRKLIQNRAATQQQIDQTEGQIEVLKKKIASVEVQKQSVYAELETLDAKIDQVEDKLSRARIKNPVAGVVLDSYAEPNELVTIGKPLYTIANLNEMELRVYVSGAQLPSVRLGTDVEVIIDKDEYSTESLKGTVSWIASEAEFTPRMIQTRKERVTQVYAVKVRVPNADGKLKIGMPGEVNFLSD